VYESTTKKRKSEVGAQDQTLIEDRGKIENPLNAEMSPPPLAGLKVIQALPYCHQLNTTIENKNLSTSDQFRAESY
jgi:hypothetical protein